MAKWGEGDPRWIVEERNDATNVNNWHWKEKDATSWSKTKLKSLLEGLTLNEDNLGYCQIKELTALEGEASANNRKAKLFFFYEWTIKGDWTGQVNGDSKKHRGKIEIHNLSEEYLPEEAEVIVTSNTEKPNALRLKEFIRVIGVIKIRKKLSQYVKHLKEEFSQGLILPTVDSSKNLQDMDQENYDQKEFTARAQVSDSGTGGSGSQSLPPPSSSSLPATTAAPSAATTPAATSSSHPSSPQQSSSSSPSTASGTIKIKTKSYTCREEFKCSAEELYNVLTQHEAVTAFTRSSCFLEAHEGGKFSLLNGNITGNFTKMTCPSELGMEWRLKSWPDGHFSQVKIDIIQHDDFTELTLNQTAIPIHLIESTSEGWSQYYWNSIKSTFGYGTRF